MRAAWYDRSGPAEDVFVVGSRPDPVPLPGEVLIRVRYSGVNPSDWKARAGWAPAARAKPVELGTIAHYDGAGEIVAVGEGVDRARVGERVWIWHGAHRGFGTAAEFCIVPSERAVRLPDSVPLEIGACLGVPAITANAVLFTDGPLTRKSVLIAAGAGSVGSYAVQLAAAAGARVAATASTPEKQAIARELGAATVVDYRAADAADRLLAFAGEAGFDRIVEVDLGANLELDLKVAAINGVIASYSSTTRPSFEFPYYGFAAKGLTLRVVQAYRLAPELRAAAVTAISSALERGTLCHRIAAVVPLAEIARAHALAESGKLVGKVLVEIG
jgi:NADPH:quinone reductase-like Zn-dependent oxidoreductase